VRNLGYSTIYVSMVIVVAFPILLMVPRIDGFLQLAPTINGSITTFVNSRGLVCSFDCRNSTPLFPTRTQPKPAATTLIYPRSRPDIPLLSQVECQSWDQLPLLLPCGSASSAVTQTVLDDVMTEDVPMQEIRDDPISRCPNTIILTAPRPRGDTALLLMGSRHFADENDAPNVVSPCKGDRQTKRGEKRKSPSRGLGGMVQHPLPMPLPPTIQPMRSITPPPPSQFRSLPQECIGGEEPRPLKMCCGVSVGNLGANLTAAAAVYKHTAKCLRDFVSNPNFGMKRFDSMRQKWH
jgi:hypothetical protein